MSKVEKTIVIDAPIERVFDVVSDIESYPDFLPEFKKARIKKKGKTDFVAELTINMMKEIDCEMSFKKKAPTLFSWTLIKGEMMKENRGSWRLKKLGVKKTEVTYSIKVELDIFIPSGIINMMIENNLMKTIERFKKRAEK